MVEVKLKPKPEQKPSSILLSDLIDKPREPSYCKICGIEIRTKFVQHGSYCTDECGKFARSLKDGKGFREKGEWAYVLINGQWIYQPISLALENKAKGYKIFTYDDYKKWLRGQNV